MKKSPVFIRVPDRSITSYSNPGTSIYVPAFKITQAPLRFKDVRLAIHRLASLKHPKVAKRQKSVFEEWSRSNDDDIVLNATNLEAAVLCNSLGARLPSIFELISATLDELGSDPSRLESLSASYEEFSNSDFTATSRDHLEPIYVQQDGIEHYRVSVLTHSSSHPAEFSAFDIAHAQFPRYVEPRIFVDMLPEIAASTLSSHPDTTPVRQVRGPFSVLETALSTSTLREYRPYPACIRAVIDYD